MKFRHSAHNYRMLVRKWHVLIDKIPLNRRKLMVHNKLPVFEISNDLIRKNVPGIYLSAGIHGDEPAPCWALLYWAEKNVDLFNHIPVIILPCLNPWGFINNSRFDQNGEDLNRLWGNHSHPFIEKIVSRIKDLSFHLTLNLHEDFDANGIYLYEPPIEDGNDSWAREILSAGQKVLPIDNRKKIEGRFTEKGIIRPDKNNPPLDGIPEALYLTNTYKVRNFTLETPSEESINDRIASHLAMIEESIKVAFQL